MMRANIEKFLKKQILDMAARIKTDGDLIEDGGGPPEEIRRLLDYQLYDQGMMAAFQLMADSLDSLEKQTAQGIK